MVDKDEDRHVRKDAKRLSGKKADTILQKSEEVSANLGKAVFLQNNSEKLSTNKLVNIRPNIWSACDL